MRLDKFRAYKLRISGRSYREINKLLGIPKSTLSGWFTGLNLPDKARARINKLSYDKSTLALINRNKVQTKEAEKRAYLARSGASSDVGRLSRRELFLIGIALYWAEGYKKPMSRNGRVLTSHYVSLTNSDPKLIALFLRFIREVCKVREEKIKANLRILERQDETYLLDFWQKISKIPFGRFGKVYKGVVAFTQRKDHANTLPYGTFQIRIGDTALFHRIMGWIDGLSNGSG